MKSNGFTLIELLVVIAIIGLLVTIVMVNVQNPRARARDANIKTFLHQLRNAAQINYNQNGNYSAVCDENDNTLSNSGDFGFLEEALKEENPDENVTCIEAADKESFAASFPLVARNGKHWCVEAAGTGVEIDNPITSATCQ
jgi:prepilin-type N-terminal cleavage/methylation domain-containing protein